MIDVQGMYKCAFLLLALNVTSKSTPPSQDTRHISRIRRQKECDVTARGRGVWEMPASAHNVAVVATCTRSSQSKVQHGWGKGMPESAPNKGAIGCWLQGNNRATFPWGHGHWQVDHWCGKSFCICTAFIG